MKPGTKNTKEYAVDGTSACKSWGLSLSFATSLIAALATTADFSAWARYALAILPLVSSLTTSVLSQIRFYDLWKLREEGRLQFQDLSIEAERVAAAATDADSGAIHEKLQKRVSEIEMAQSGSFFGLYNSNLVLQVKKPGS